MKPKYCLPIIKFSKEAVVQAIAFHKDEYDFFEVWLDYVKDPTPQFVTHLITEYGKQLIFLFRRRNLEKEQMEYETRVAIIESIQHTEAFIDIDVEHQKDILALVNKKQMATQLIASYHNYLHTPSDEILNDIIKTMQSYKPAIYKISTYCKTEEDALRLMLYLYKLKKENKHCIILGMGEFGIITRIFGTLWGNEMIFAPVSTKEASAPGQLTKQQLESIFTILQKGAA